MKKAGDKRKNAKVESIKPKFSFSFKIALIIAILLISAITVYAIITIVREQEHMINSMIDEKIALNEMIAVMSAEVHATPAHIREMVRIVAEAEDILYCRIVKPTGEIHLSNIEEERGRFIRDPAIATDKTIVKDDVYNGEEIKVVISPAYRNYTIWLGFTLKSVHPAFDEMMIGSMITLFVITSISLTVTYFASSWVVSPIRKLTDLCIEVSRGNLNVRSDVKSKAEIRILESTFNKMIEDLRGYHARLERKVRERTRELEEANERLKELDRLKDEFLGVISHELRTPLTPIRGYTELLLNRKLGDITGNQEESLRTILRNVGRLTKLINNILDITKIETKRMRFNMKELQFEQIIDNVIKDMTPIADKKHLTLTKYSPGKLPKIIGDPDRLTQVLANLVDNAIRFTEKGEVRVETFVNNGKLIVSVKDTGMGIPRERIGNLFTKFYQVNPLEAPKNGGTGLGLAICRGIIEKHGGKIWVESVLGRGSTFSFSLPIVN